MKSPDNAFYAHSKEGEPSEKWQRLDAHLKNVADLAGDFADVFGAKQWGYVAGLWHDLGKYADQFQNKLLQENTDDASDETAHNRVNHSSAGGWYSIQKFPQGHSLILSYLIMGHHAGLTDYHSEYVGNAALEKRMRGSKEVTSLLKSISGHILNIDPPNELIRGDASFWIRMLYSCLVDADYLDTESFMDEDRSGIRSEKYPQLKQLEVLFGQFMKGLHDRAKRTPVNRIREVILKQCLKEAERSSRIFSLTVPTGGGKTLSSMAFALRHAVKHNKNRIIYVIPYTSIIEQTADIFRAIPGFEHAVIEHHSNLRDDEGGRDSLRNRLAAENWDAPVIVTTAVQFFESLYSNRSSRCRKLHNVAESVVIFDEAQCLPPDYLRPVVFAVKELHLHYGVTPVLCTATQPELGIRNSFDFKFKEGFESTHEIMEDTISLYDKLKRVDIELHKSWPRPVSWEDLAAELAQYETVLCIVNRRDDCRDLFRLMPGGTIHLSALMCGEHRSRVIQEIKRRLKAGIPTRVVSTQLVEAGVDIDSPVVYRALAGLDSIAQAAGRCNREGGLLPHCGKTVVFIPPSRIPCGHLAQAADIGQEVISRHIDNPLSPNAIKEFFDQLYWMKGDEGLDRKGILRLLPPDKTLEYAFRTAAALFRLIDEEYLPVIVQYEESMKFLDELRQNPWNARKILRKLQRYAVNLPEKVHHEMQHIGHIKELKGFDRIYIQETTGIYREDIGFCQPSDKGFLTPDDLII
jgi:CRISPR-associated endonuclease/helicase Cas3